MFVLMLTAIPALAEEEVHGHEEGIADHDHESEASHWLVHILDITIIVVFAIAAVMAFRLSKKLYGGRFTNALPYLMIAIVLLLAMPVLHWIGHLLDLGHSMDFMFGMQSLQILAGIFFIWALYNIYQTRFATEGFNWGGKK